VRARLLHGKWTLDSPQITLEQNGKTFEVRAGKHWTEMLIRFKAIETNTLKDNEVMVTVETNNIKVAIAIAEKLLRLSIGDDFLYANFTNTGAVQEYVRVEFPPWYLESKDLTKAEVKRELIPMATILFSFDDKYLTIENMLTDFVLNFKDEAIGDLKKAKNMVDTLGDDFLTMAFREQVTALLKDAPEWAEDRVKQIVLALSI